ncbi:L-aspartate oxidase [Candidatus Micrarchaeota archaeon]|nr:L-aspartate oxidase [Candidatus Micrarchaeota archaeon]
MNSTNSVKTDVASKTDILVAGSGIAGLIFALKASEFANIALITKKSASISNTAYAQGGIAIPLDEKDELHHINDTLIAGRGLCNKKAVELMVKSARGRIHDLVSFGIPFDTGSGQFKRSLEAGHTFPRVIYNSDATGKAIEKTLVNLVRNNSKIILMENSLLLDLIVAKNGSGKNGCVGAKILTNANQIQTINSKFTVLATGGLGNIFEHTTNPPVATGDGFAIASRIGAKMGNMEFVQFHPTKLDVKSNAPFLISEALRGEGAVLLNSKNEKFMKKYDQLGDLAPRDVVAHAIYQESLHGKVYLDITSKPLAFLKNRFPNIYSKCLEFGFDLSKDKIPIVPAAHYMCGGVKTDLDARTTVANLYAIGEVACTGVQGANRLASNSLLEGIVFSHQACIDIKKRFSGNKTQKSEIFPTVPNPPILPNPKTIRTTSKIVDSLRIQIQKIMWEKVGVVRKTSQLIIAINDLEKIEKSLKVISKKGMNYPLAETLNMAQTSLLVANAALRRKKSLGCHYIE